MVPFSMRCICGWDEEPANSLLAPPTSTVSNSCTAFQEEPPYIKRFGDKKCFIFKITILVF